MQRRTDRASRTSPLAARRRFPRRYAGAPGSDDRHQRRQLLRSRCASHHPESRRAELITEYEDTLANPYIAAERGYVDAVITPHETRVEVVRALRLLRTKRETLPPKKHGNIPL